MLTEFYLSNARRTNQKESETHCKYRNIFPRADERVNRSLNQSSCTKCAKHCYTFCKISNIPLLFVRVALLFVCVPFANSQRCLANAVVVPEKPRSTNHDSTESYQIQPNVRPSIRPVLGRMRHQQRQCFASSSQPNENPFGILNLDPSNDLASTKLQKT